MSIVPPEAARHCAEIARRDDPDRFFAAQFAPPHHRDALIALSAFAAEIARVRDSITQPMAGEVRLQWWRDALTGSARGDAAANPIVAAILPTLETARVTPDPLLRLIDARTFDLYDDPMPSLNELEGYAGDTASVLVRLACLVLADGRDPGGAAACGHAGVAIALTGLMRALPWHARRGQVYLPADLLLQHGVTREDIVSGRGGPGLKGALADLRAIVRKHLRQAEDALDGLDAAVKPAFLPLALCEPRLRLMERGDYDPLATIVSRPLWRDLLTLWWVNRRRR